jgi:hypothetical protein
LGYVSGLFEKLGATIVDYVHLPFLKMVNSILPAFGEQVKKIGGWFGQDWGDGIGRFSERMKGELDGFQKFITNTRNLDPAERANRWREQARLRHEHGKGLMAERDARDRSKAEEAAEAIAQSGHNAAGLVAKAIIMGSQESVAMLAQAQARAMGMKVDDPAKQALGLHKETNKLAGEQLSELKKLNTKKETKVGVK